MLSCFCFYYSPALPNAANKKITTGENNAAGIKINAYNFTDSLPKTINDTVVVPFEYQQSSLNYSYTFRLIDSAVAILISDTSVTLSIDGYSHVDEASTNICYYLSLNRALAVKSYVIGRGIDSSRILAMTGRGNLRSIKRKVKKESVKFNCTAEIVLNYPVPAPEVVIKDMDGDGIADDEDSCVNEYGERSRHGCPDKNAIIVPFELQQSALFSKTYAVLDSVISILRADPSLFVTINGYAWKKEGVESICDQLAQERADIVRRYLLTRQLDPSRIDSVKSFGSLHPISAGRNPWEIVRNSRAEIFLIRH